MKQLLNFMIIIGISIGLYAIEFDKPVYEKSLSIFDRAKSLFSFENSPKHEPIVVKKEDWKNNIVKILNNEIKIASKDYHIEGRRILLLPNKSYFVFARTTNHHDASNGTLIVKFTEHNKLKWVKHYKANDVMLSTKYFIDNDGLLISGAYITGKFLESPFIFRIDFNGNIKWAKDYNEKLMRKSYNSIIKINGGYIATGYIIRGFTKIEYKDNSLHMEGTKNLTYSPLVTKLNSKGEKVWDKIIEAKEESYAVEIVTADTNYLVRTIPTVKSQKIINTKPQEVIINSNGKIISKKAMKKLPTHIEKQYGIAPPSVMYKSIIVKRLENKDFQISKLNNNGTDLWKYNIKITNKFGDKINIIETSDGGCLIENFQYSFLQGSTFLIKLDNMGKEEWKKNYKGKKGRFIFNDHMQKGENKYLFLVTTTIILDAKLKNEADKTSFNIASQSIAKLIELDLNSNKNEETNNLP